MTIRGDVVIAGVGCRLAGIRGSIELWEHLRAPKPRFDKLAADRWKPELHTGELAPDLLATIENAALLTDFSVDFRALRIPPLQLERMHRMDVLAVGTMCEALFNAGVQPGVKPDENAHVIVAAHGLGPDPTTDTTRRIRRFEMQGPVSRAMADLPEGERQEVDELVEQLFNLAAPPMEPDSMLTSSSIVAGRLANIFNFRGGHHVVDCGAASSIAALEQGFDRIRSGEAHLVVVAAFSPMLTGSGLLRHAASGLLGDPQPFSPESRGMRLGEGCVAVVLRRAEDTKKAYAVIDRVELAGCWKTRDADDVEAALDRAMTRATAACSAASVRYVASRASGVKDIDGAEHKALQAHFPTDVSVSTQAGYVGHLQAASGLLAVVEAALAAKNGVWPKTGTSIEAEQRIAVCDAGFGSVAGVALLRRAEQTGHPRVLHPTRFDDLAVVSMGVVAPRADSVPKFWSNILANVEAIGDLPTSRFDAERLIGSGNDAASMLNTRLAGIVDTPTLNLDRLAIKASDLEHYDPAVTLSLKVAIEAFSQLDLDRYPRDRVDVIFGQLPLRATECTLETRLLFAHHLHLVQEALGELGWDEARANQVLSRARTLFDQTTRHFDAASFEAFTGSTCAQMVARAFGLRGLVASTDSACASAMAALKIGIDRLSNGRTDVVLAGGVAYNILPEFYISLSMLGFLSSDAAPPFSRGSNGFVPAEGAGCIAVKRRADAERDGDRILALIKAVGASCDGRGQAVLAPNTDGQRLAIQRAMRSANITPGDIDVLEAHGAGTQVGDQVEMESYAAIYGEAPRTTPLAVGALKSQIGHTSSASGALGLIKAVLSLDSCTIAPSNLNEETRESLPFGRGFEVQTTKQQWFVLPGKRRYAAVTSIGMGGSNYHVVLQRYDGAAEMVDMRPTLPSRGTFASRFVIDSTPQPLPRAAKRRELGKQHVLLIADTAGVAQGVTIGLQERGALVTVLEPTQVVAETLAQARAQHGRFVGVVDLSTFAPDPGLRGDLTHFTTALNADNQRFFAIARDLYDDLNEPSAFFYTITALGADFGLLGGNEGHVLGASRQGFARALKQEVQTLDSKAFDFALGTTGPEVSDAVLAELDDDNHRTDVAYRGTQRFVPQFTRRSFAENETVLRSFGEGDVVLFTGGGRGVTFVCAKALAERGVKVVVCGRTEAARGDEPWLGYDDNAFALFKQQELTRRRAEQPTITPASFNRQFASFSSQRELHQNLLKARALNLDLHYVACDVTDLGAVRAMIQNIHTAHGPLAGVVHGAMVESSRSVPSKTDDIIQATFATKATALLCLWEATKSEPLRSFMCFGSGAGRFGNKGQTDYAGANALMAHLLASLANNDARLLHHTTLDWTAWEGAGAAVADPALADLVRRTGVSSIRPEEGEYWFVAEMFFGRSGEALVFDERMLHTWPFMGSRADGVGEQRRYGNGFGEIIVPGEFPMLDGVQPSQHTAERVLDLKRDGFIAQHRLYDTPILPATFGVELLAEAAVALTPGFALHRLEDFQIHTPAKLHRGEPLALQVGVALESETANTRTLLVESRSKLVVKGRILQELRLHHSARVVMGRELPPILLKKVVEPGGVGRARSFFHMAQDPVGLGPIFSRAAWIKVEGRSVFGRVRAPRMRDIFTHTTFPRFQVDPIVLDAAFQIAANWDGLSNDNVSIPFSVESIEAGRTRGLAEEARVVATVTKVQDPDVYYDIFVVGERDEVLLTVRGLLLRRIAKISASSTAGAS